jgi:hypothetical protein
VAPFLSSFIFGNVNKILKRFTFTLVYVCFAFGFYVFATAHNRGSMLSGTFNRRLGIGFYMPSIYARVPEVAPACLTSLCQHLAAWRHGLGQFLQPYGFSFIQNVFGLEIGRQLVGAASVIFVGFIVISVIITFFKSRHQYRETMPLKKEPCNRKEAGFQDEAHNVRTKGVNFCGQILSPMFFRRSKSVISP